MDDTLKRIATLMKEQKIQDQELIEFLSEFRINVMCKHGVFK